MTDIDRSVRDLLEEMATEAPTPQPLSARSSRRVSTRRFAVIAMATSIVALGTAATIGLATGRLFATPDTPPADRGDRRVPREVVGEVIASGRSLGVDWWLTEAQFTNEPDVCPAAFVRNSGRVGRMGGRVFGSGCLDEFLTRDDVLSVGSAGSHEDWEALWGVARSEVTQVLVTGGFRGYVDLYDLPESGGELKAFLAVIPADLRHVLQAFGSDGQLGRGVVSTTFYREARVPTGPVDLIASADWNRHHWVLAAYPGKEGPCLKSLIGVIGRDSNLQKCALTRPGPDALFGAFQVILSPQLASDIGAPVFGTVRSGAKSVYAEMDDGTEIPAQIIPAPEGLDLFGVDFYFLISPPAVTAHGRVIALDSNGQKIDERRLCAPFFYAEGYPIQHPITGKPREFVCG